ncbi:MAG: hypothetical protein NT154_41905 [Verrucomicrobia bacterium]|nr:hypothetical protein [Verrucomicrobiota bacterium]
MTRLQHWLFTLRAALSDDDAKLASGGGQLFPGGIPVYPLSSCREFWVFDLNHVAIEVYREPHFAGYASKTILRAGDQAKPLAFPDAVVDVADLLKR